MGFQVKTRLSKGFLYTGMSCVLLWVFLFWLIVGCDSRRHVVGDLDKNINSFQADVRAAVYLRTQTLNLVREYHRIGAIVAEHNSFLTLAERYEIGRTVLIYSEATGLSPDLVLAIIIVESWGNIYAVSPKGAKGLMQLMPEWIKENDDPFVIDTNIKIGTTLLADNIKNLGLERGIQAYFWGNKKPRGWYLARVKEAMEKLDG